MSQIKAFFALILGCLPVCNVSEIVHVMRVPETTWRSNKTINVVWEFQRWLTNPSCSF